MNDHERARKLREKGWAGPSASSKAKSKGSRSGRRSEPAPESTEEALRNFDYNPSDGRKIKPVARSEESKSRARAFKSRLPRLG